MLRGVPFVLLVEDDDDERLLAERALTRAGVNSLIHIADGLQAKSFLEAQAASKDPQMPDIVLMDLKLPGMGGHEVLEWMATRPEFHSLLRYVLSSSGNPQDRVRAEQAQIAGYFVKPLTGPDVESLKHDYLENLARLSSGGGSPA